MLVKELKEVLNRCNDELEVEAILRSHEHIYNSVNKEVGVIEIEHIIPINSANIKFNDGYGVVLLSNIQD